MSATDYTLRNIRRQEDESEGGENAAALEQADLARLQHRTLATEEYVLRALIDCDPASVPLAFGVGHQAEQTVQGDPRAPFNGIAVFNYGTVPVYFGFAVGAARAAGQANQAFTVAGGSFVVLPGRFADCSVGVDAAGAAAAAFPVTVMRLRLAPTPGAGLLAPATGGLPADVIDRAGRLLGHVTIDAGSVSPVPIADTVSAAGLVAGPGAGVVVAQTPVLADGSYAVEVHPWIGAGNLAVDDNNMQLQHGVTVVGALTVTGPGAGPWPGVYHFPRVTTVGGQRITVNAIAAATGGVPYRAFIAATRIA